MLYKVTPMLTPVDKSGKVGSTADKQADSHQPKEARKRRKSAVYDAEGNEVLITMMCLKCRTMKPLGMFGLRKMADGAIRNQPWCRTCRSGAGTKKKNEAPDEVHDTELAADAAEAPITVETPAVERLDAPPSVADDVVPV